METWHDSKWEPGSPWKLMVPDGRVLDAGEVVEVDRPRRLVLRWRNELFPEYHDDLPSRFIPCQVCRTI
jgi:uncharacterized protein YndB with AHSA1/START domain